MAKRFGFGKNWQSYLSEYFSEEHLSVAQAYLLETLGYASLEGKSFLDIGSGSGLHSLAAYCAGAEKIVSFDYDEHSVEATKQLRTYAKADPERWVIVQGSALDRDFLAELGKFDIVYSWGVLHHTGDKRRALLNLSIVMHDYSLIYISLYAAESYAFPSLQYWLDLKQEYLGASQFKKRFMEMRYIWRYECGSHIRNIPRIISLAKNYKQTRGMAFYVDVKDWLGGWPMEFSYSYEVIETAKKEMNLDVLKLLEGKGCTEYLFCSTGKSEALGHQIYDRNVEHYEVFNADLEIPDSQAIWIFGTGKGGEIMFRELKQRGLSIAGFINTFEAGEKYGLPIMKLSDFAIEYDASSFTDIIIVASNHSQEIRQSLWQHNYSYIIDARSHVAHNC